jgi:glycosyltransferase involved in cell wall biosynthesis
VVDCFSTDSTVAIAEAHGAEVVQHAWVNYATQFNWALDNVKIDTQWIMRLDADEIVTPELANALRSRLSGYPKSVAGLTVNRQIHFMGRWIRHGGMYPIRMLRVWRTGRGCCENRWMDEHIIVDGEIGHLDADIADVNLNNVTWWTGKHNQYASREAVDLLMHRGVAYEQGSAQLNVQAKLKRWLKLRVYARLPLGLRSLLYFLYRYFLRLGFLDSWQGLVFHFLQGFWYRFLVDVKVHELETLMKERQLTLQQAVREEFGYEI